MLSPMNSNFRAVGLVGWCSIAGWARSLLLLLLLAPTRRTANSVRKLGLGEDAANWHSVDLKTRIECARPGSRPPTAVMFERVLFSNWAVLKVAFANPGTTTPSTSTTK